MIAVDTNILVYSISGDEPVFQPAAQSLLGSLDPAKTVLLWQVACEFAAVATRLSRQGRLAVDVGTVARALRQQYTLVLPSPAVLDKAIEIHMNHQVSYWDAALIAACIDAGVTRLYSQDIQSAPMMQGVEIIDPLPKL